MRSLHFPYKPSPHTSCTDAYIVLCWSYLVDGMVVVVASCMLCCIPYQLVLIRSLTYICALHPDLCTFALVFLLSNSAAIPQVHRWLILCNWVFFHPATCAKTVFVLGQLALVVVVVCGCITYIYIYMLYNIIIYDYKHETIQEPKSENILVAPLVPQK